MPYQPLTEDQFNSAKSKGFSADQIINFEKQRKGEIFAREDPQFKGGALSPDNVQAQRDVRKAQMMNKLMNVIAEAGQESTKRLPFGDSTMKLNPRNIAGEVGKAASFFMGPIGGSATYMGSQALEDKKSPGGIALQAGLGAVGGAALKAVFPLIGKAIDMIPKPVADRIYNLYNSAVGGARIKNIGDINKIKSDRIAAVKAIHENLADIKLQNPETGEMESRTPQNRLELAHAFQQTKQNIWKKVTSLSKGATDQGATINLGSMAEKAGNDAKKSIGNVALKANPGLASSIDNAVANIRMAGERISPTDAQEFMKYLNSEVSRLRQSGQAVDYSTKDLYSNLLNHLNEETDTAIERALDKGGYRDLRRQYSALKSSEKEIINGANKYSRKQGAGGVSHPFVNLWSLEDALQGVAEGAMGNPVGGAFKIARGAAIKGASSLTDHLLSPDRKIKQMFDLIEKHAPGESQISNLEGTNLNKIGEEFSQPRVSVRPTTDRPLLGLPKPEPQYLRERQQSPIPPLGVNSENPYMQGIRVGENPIKKISGPQAEYIKNRQSIEKENLGATGKPLDIEFTKGGSKETIPMRGASRRATTSSYSKGGETGSVSTKALVGTSAVGAGIIGANKSQASEDIDMNKITSMESSGNPNAVSDKGAVGLEQITKPALDAFNKSHKSSISMDKMKDPKLNSKVGNWYMNKEIPRLLRHYKIPDNKDNRLRAYNEGIGNLKHHRRFKETEDYVRKYNT